MKPDRSARSPRALRIRRRRPAGAHLVVLGAGGNIGSHLVPLLARLPNVARLTLVDFDSYVEKNLQSQDITRSDVGRAKARVQARRARQINPQLAVVSIVDRFERVPLGHLRGVIILACLDSKESRRCANEIAWRLGVPWIDAGVESSQMLARVNVYLPAAGQPCLECAWGERDYANLPVVYPCDPGAANTPATNAPACLGALAAALQAIECQKLLTGQSAAALIGRQVLIAAATQQQFITVFRRNPNCRFDHETWKVSTLRQTAPELSIGAILKPTRRPGALASLAFGGQPIVTRLDCPGCGFTRHVFRLQHRLRSADRSCARCNREMLSAGFHMKTRLSRADLGPGDADRSLASLGLRPGDVVSLSRGETKTFFELPAGNVSHPHKPIKRRNP